MSLNSESDLNGKKQNRWTQEGGIHNYNVTVSLKTLIQRPLLLREHEAVASCPTWTNSSQNWKKTNCHDIVSISLLIS